MSWRGLPSWERKRDAVDGSRIRSFGKSQKQVEEEKVAVISKDVKIGFDWGKVQHFDDLWSRYYAAGGVVGRATMSEQGDPNDYALVQARRPVEKYLLKTSHDLSWESVVGNEKARTALLEAIEHPVTHADLYAKYSMPMSKGVLLFGAPGCGKTMLAKAAASAMARLHGKEVEFMVINGPSIQSVWVGETEKLIRQIFEYARLYHKKHGHQLVIFIDEADAILPSRDGGARWEASNVATFLTEMDGMESSGAFVILATNRPHALDQALLRDGRCDRKIKVERPDAAAAEIILANTLKGAPLAADMHGNIPRVVETLFDPMYLLRRISDGMGGQHHFNLGHIVSGAMIVGLVQRAKGIAFRREMAGEKLDGVSFADFRQAIDEVFQENHGLDHTYALQEFVESIPAAVEKRAAIMN